MPLRDQAVGLQSSMKRAGGNAVQVGLISPAEGAKAVQIEVRIAQLQRVEGPFNQPDSASQSFVALEQFQHPADASVAVISVHAGHVGMEIRHGAAKPDDRK